MPIRNASPMMRWRLDRLWSLRLPIRRMRMEDLQWLLDLPVWQYDGVRFQVTPRQVLDEPERFPDHLRRVMAANLGYPIHLVSHHGRLVILDGFHRLAKAVIEERHEIDAMVLSPEDLASISTPD